MTRRHTVDQRVADMERVVSQLNDQVRVLSQSASQVSKLETLVRGRINYQGATPLPQANILRTTFLDDDENFDESGLALQPNDGIPQSQSHQRKVMGLPGTQYPEGHELLLFHRDKRWFAFEENRERILKIVSDEADNDGWYDALLMHYSNATWIDQGEAKVRVTPGGGELARDDFVLARWEFHDGSYPCYATVPGGGEPGESLRIVFLTDGSNEAVIFPDKNGYYGSLDTVLVKMLPRFFDAGVSPPDPTTVPAENNIYLWARDLSETADEWQPNTEYQFHDLVKAPSSSGGFVSTDLSVWRHKNESPRTSGADWDAAERAYWDELGELYETIWQPIEMLAVPEEIIMPGQSGAAKIYQTADRMSDITLDNTAGWRLFLKDAAASVYYDDYYHLWRPRNQQPSALWAMGVLQEDIAVDEDSAGVLVQYGLGWQTGFTGDEIIVSAENRSGAVGHQGVGVLLSYAAEITSETGPPPPYPHASPAAPQTPKWLIMYIAPVQIEFVGESQTFEEQFQSRKQHAMGYPIPTNIPTPAPSFRQPVFRPWETWASGGDCPVEGAPINP